MTWYTTLTCSLTFQPPDETVIKLSLEVTTKDKNKDEDEFKTPLHEMHCGAFSQACRTIRDLPRLVNVKRLHICHSSRISDYTWVTLTANEIERLFKSLRPLEELTLTRCDMRPCLVPSVVSPPIKHLTIKHLLHPPREGFEAAVVGLAKSQHALGIPLPFEDVTVHMDGFPTEMAEGLGLWVGAGSYYDERYQGE